MKTVIIISCLLFGIINASAHGQAQTLSVKKAPQQGKPAQELSILFPKNNQKVRGEYKIYGKAKPGAKVQLDITSSYFKTAKDNREKISRGEGPINKMNRKFSLTADRGGTWVLKSIQLWNSGWEENFVIKATSDKKSVSVHVYDNTRPVAID